MLSEAISPGSSVQADCKLGLNHARRSTRRAADWPSACWLWRATMAAIWLPAAPAVLELRASSTTCMGAGWPCASRSAKSGGKVMTASACPLSISGAIWLAEVSVATRLNTPVLSICASTATEAALRLSSSTAKGACFKSKLSA